MTRLSSAYHTMHRLVALIVPVVSCAPASAAVNAWTPIGPNGGYTRGLAFHPTAAGVMYSIVEERFYLSTDNGVSWTPRPKEFSDTLSGLAVDPTNGDVLYVFERNVGLWRSADQGATFTFLGPRQPTPPVSCAVGALADGTTATIMLTATASAAGSASITGRASSSTTDTTARTAPHPSPSPCARRARRRVVEVIPGVAVVEARSDCSRYACSLVSFLVRAFLLRHRIDGDVHTESKAQVRPAARGPILRMVLSIPSSLMGRELNIRTLAQRVAQQLGTLHPRERYACSNEGRWIVKS